MASASPPEIRGTVVACFALLPVQWSALHFAPCGPKRPITVELTQGQIQAAPEYVDGAKPAQVVIAPPMAPTSSQ
jgi:hypothetical protein